MTRTRTRAPKPIESFGPEVLQALIEGSKKEIVLELPYRKAIYFRSRVNALRHEMGKQNHEMYRAVSQATVRVVWGEDAGVDPVPEKRSSTNVRFPANKNVPAKLIIAPADKEFGDALKKAGVMIQPLSLDTPVPNTGSRGDDDILNQYLKEEPTDVK